MTDVDAFLALLERCREQVMADPSGLINNPHLEALQRTIFLRLCHGNIEVSDENTNTA